MNDIDEISSLHLDNIEEEEREEYMPNFEDSIFEMSSIQNLNQLKFF